MARLDHISRQTSFLTDAAHLLAISSPETSAYLMRQRNSLLLTQDIYSSDVQKQHACTSCGHIMIPGQGDTLKLEVDRALNQKRGRRQQPGPRVGKRVGEKSEAGRSPKTVEATTKVYTCGMCHQFTKIALPSPSPIVRKKKTAIPQRTGSSPSAQLSTLGNAGSIEKTPSTSANAGSKRRAKSRKAGLQALLSQAQREPVKKPGLTLADFMAKR